MSLAIPDNGLLLEGPTEAAARRSPHAFAVPLSAELVAQMIESAQNGGKLQLSLSDDPAIFIEDQEVPLQPELLTEPVDYELFYTNPNKPTRGQRVLGPVMSIFDYYKRAKARKAAQTTKPSNGIEGAVENLKNSFAKVEADKRENSALIVEGLPSKKGAKINPGKARLLGSQTNGTSRSISVSPALSGLGSPSLGPTSNGPGDRLKQQKFPIIHELAAQNLTFEELLERYDGDEQEFHPILNKVADFDSDEQKWVLKKMYWKELDVFEYAYATDEDRQKAIDNAIKQYDRMRLGVSDPLWQKLLPKGERGKGICLSKLHATIAKNSQTVPTPNRITGTASPSGAETEKGEPMSRSNSQTGVTKKKVSASVAQAKRLATAIANAKKPGRPSAAKATASKVASPRMASPKVASTKVTGSKGPAAKGGRILSKEIITDSDSDEDEVPLSKSLGRTQGVSAPAPGTKKSGPPVEKYKTAAKSIEAPSPKTKQKPKAAPIRAVGKKKVEETRDTIRAQPIPKTTKPMVSKRPRDPEDDESSSSGTPLSQRVKPVPKPKARPDATTKSGSTFAKGKFASPQKSSPLASSPLTNASDNEEVRRAIVSRPQKRERERERDREVIVSSASSNAGSVNGDVGSRSKKRPAPSDYASGNIGSKRPRLDPDILSRAEKFKRAYTRYEALHREVSSAEDPSSEKVESLMRMHARLQIEKKEIYSAVTLEND
ncbi:hypothetical protein GE21DRAFT_796 [Neurospora crassa]|uniref:E3 ubiquitin-protein ligase UBR1-like winged-helix domain-containing protein n=2 Tax=Neurospora crassa TaxID=5141 RepID=V5IP88_NEUCR|nr:uncharacterized protein NCU02609 [Neurospora crassa OR74A]XP_011392983.1 hypothetical protein NCU02609 [Neurospora crassa OR74A]KHE90049.1 hypothetical protein GE21DRAFT_796 [Neurospora crassa]ESA43933.1 hypothetical protein NCU02609 [Neurospora crassa OR74A]ESA43934.1 hypothetical protein, variant [Neurospora crassa OR74A]CAE76455.1 conserved hypothetical protein [Neurospora crassa]|eukprot:XP_011392982.1 uncharacterized protein NCU02609 [Neurospora crassa OR74A]